MATNNGRVDPVEIVGGSRLARLYPEGSANAPQLTARVPTEFPPKNSLHFSLVGWAEMVGNSQAEPAELKLIVPVGRRGVIDAISFYVNDMAATTDARFTVRVNGLALAGFDRMRVFPSALAYKNVVRSGLGIEIPERARISVLLEKLDAGTNRLGASIDGWAYLV